MKPPKGDDDLNEEALGLLREVQRQELSDSDWTQLSDVGLTDATKLGWQEYRKAIRDLPDEYSDILDINEVVFPVKPE